MLCNAVLVCVLFSLYRHTSRTITKPPRSWDTEVLTGPRHGGVGMHWWPASGAILNDDGGRLALRPSSPLDRAIRRAQLGYRHRRRSAASCRRLHSSACCLEAAMACHARQPGSLAIAGTRSHRERPLLLKHARLALLERRTDRCRDGGGESVRRCCLHPRITMRKNLTRTRPKYSLFSLSPRAEIRSGAIRRTYWLAPSIRATGSRTGAPEVAIGLEVASSVTMASTAHLVISELGDLSLQRGREGAPQRLLRHRAGPTHRLGGLTYAVDHVRPPSPPGWAGTRGYLRDRKM